MTFTNKQRFQHFLDVYEMEHQRYGADVIPKHIKDALNAEIAKDVSGDYETVLAPFRAELSTLYRGCFN